MPYGLYTNIGTSFMVIDEECNMTKGLRPETRLLQPQVNGTSQAGGSFPFTILLIRDGILSST